MPDKQNAIATLNRIPESHRRGHEGVATTVLMGGFVPMLVLSYGIRWAPVAKRADEA